jgi:hypothetical protein
MNIVKFVKKNKKVVRFAAAAGIAVMALSVILIQKGEKKPVLEIDVEPNDVLDVPFDLEVKA